MKQDLFLNQCFRTWSSSYMINRVQTEHTSIPLSMKCFFLCWAEHTKNISDIRILKVEEARIQGELLECSCCFDDECLLEDMMACSDGHLFCKDCVKRSSETVIGDGKSQFPCLEADCEHVFPLSVIQVVLPHNSFSSLLRRLQEEEVKQADIPDLISCPFCSFATIMPDPENKVFKCLQPDCLKESCRWPNMNWGLWSTCYGRKPCSYILKSLKVNCLIIEF